MLLAQPFEDPFKEQQKRKAPFLARCRFVSSRTKRVLQNLKDRLNCHRRDYQTVMMPEHYFMITPPLPPHPPPPHSFKLLPYGAYYDPYMSPMMLSPSFPPMHHPFGGSLPHHVLPYCICVHLDSLPYSHSIPKRHQQQLFDNSSSRNYQNIDHSFTTESTLYSPSSSFIIDDDEKEQLEEAGSRSKNDLQQCESMDATAAPRLTRSHSDIISNRRQQRRPSINHRWNSNENRVYYS